MTGFIPGLPGEGSGGSGSTVIIQQVATSSAQSLSAVTICNIALSKLGAESILSLVQDSQSARVMNLRYASLRDSELHKYRWRFSIKRTSLPKLTAAPDSDYDNQYQLPVDYLRLVEGGDVVDVADLNDFRMAAGQALVSVENGLLLTNLGAPLAIRYIARITDIGIMNPSFVEALASRIAYETCEAITQSSAKRQLAQQDYRDAIREARRANAIESPPQSNADGEWILARLG